MEYEISKGQILQTLEDIWQMFPDKDFGQIIEMTVGKEIFYLNDRHLIEVLRDFQLQNM
jgi:hypothetical protein